MVRKIFLLNVPTKDEAEDLAIRLAARSTAEGHGRTHRIGVKRGNGVGGYHIMLYIHEEVNQHAE